MIDTPQYPDAMFGLLTDVVLKPLESGRRASLKNVFGLPLDAVLKRQRS